jgi:hypothetical protein
VHIWVGLVGAKRETWLQAGWEISVGFLLLVATFADWFWLGLHGLLCSACAHEDGMSTYIYTHIYYGQRASE